MNEKVKFRVWWHTWGRGTMHYDEDWAITAEGDLLCLDTDLEGTGISGWGKVGRQSSYKILLFTGLKDKSGKEIYDGDVIKMRDTKYQVKYVHAEFRLSNLESGNITNSWSLSSQPQGTLEKIGNIYENPELLRKPE